MNSEAVGRLLAVIPRVIGREATEEVLLVGLTQQTPRQGDAVVITVPLDGATQAHLWTASVTAVEWLTAARVVRAAVIIAYSGTAGDLDGLAAMTAAALNVRADAAHLPVLDTLRVIDGRWWSYECDDPSCCPPEGTPIPTPEEHHQP